MNNSPSAKGSSRCISSDCQQPGGHLGGALCREHYEQLSPKMRGERSKPTVYQKIIRAARYKVGLSLTPSEVRKLAADQSIITRAERDAAGDFQ